MSYFADIALPTPLRRPFTYSVPPEIFQGLKQGMRVYVPVQNRFAIGIVLKIHQDKPTFRTRPIQSVLDYKPVFSTELFKLADWVHRYYYCSMGEVCQAMLPSGLNFQSVKVVKPIGRLVLSGNAIQDEFVKHLFETGEQPLLEVMAQFRLVTSEDIRILEERRLIEIREVPKTKIETAKEMVWNWTESGKTIGNEIIASSNKILKWHEAYKVLLTIKLPVKTHELEEMGCSKGALKILESAGVLEKQQREKSYSEEYYEHKPDNLRSLNPEQFDAYDQIKAGITAEVFQTYLLKGITGSGKTEVYIHAIKTCLEMGKGAIVLVPEIALTPQTVRRFYEIFGDEIAVLHSRLTPQERLFTWNELKSGNKNIAIGPRSAVFAPVENLGLIIVDEEHDSSYRQEDPAPRYHGRDTAVMRAFIEKIPIVLGSATPSLTTWKQAKEGKFELVELNLRHKGATLPKVELSDLTQYKKAMYGPLTAALYLASKDALSRNEQIIFLLNRRGYSPHLLCNDCGTIQECPNCSVSLTYHKPKSVFLCHYCGYSRYEKTPCTQCNSTELNFMGAGTQKAEEEIIALFPEAKVLRMDQDTTRKKFAHRDLTEAFRNQEYDILIGTQLVSKGLDFPNVTLVGVLNTDTELAFPSYRAQERMFQLLSQVAGRSGRGEKAGKVWFQSWKPDKLPIKAAQDHDYQLFADAELANRMELEYPPFSKMIQFTFKGKNKDDVGNAAQLFFHCIINHIPKWPVLGPAPSTIYKIEKEYFWDLLLKMHPDMKTLGIETLLDRIFEEFEEKREKKYSAVKIIVKVDF